MEISLELKLTSAACNTTVLTAQIQAVSVMRYTPAGLPALDLELLHESQLSDAGQSREVKLAMKALALGAVAEGLAGQAVGSSWKFSGFLAASRQKPIPSRTIVFHIQSYQYFNPVQPQV